MSARQLEHREISAPRVSKFNVYVEGDLKQSHVKVLTVHDLGCNHQSWFHFLENEAMVEMRKRASFIHIDIPGQEDGAKDLPADYTFPSMQSLGEDLVCVLDQLDVKNVVGLGEGAGANVIARFAMAHPKRVLGICLIHCTGTTAGFMESLKDKVKTLFAAFKLKEIEQITIVMGWKLNHIGMNPTAEAYLVLHRFGSFEKAENKEELNKVLWTFQESLRSKINPINLNRFVQAFMKRSSIAEHIDKIKCPVLMVTGDKASFNHTVHNLFRSMSQKMDKSKIEILEIEGVANVLEEKPQKLAESFLYFCQGIGVVGCVPMQRLQRASSIETEQEAKQRGYRMRSMSMEEADQPKGVYSSSPNSSAHKFSKHNLKLEKVADTEAVDVEVNDDK